MSKIGNSSFSVKIGSNTISKIYRGSSLVYSALPPYVVGPFSAGANTANFDFCADWDDQNGNVTTVGSNGGPSAYGTFDQSGQVREWNDFNGTASDSRGLRGGFWYFGFAFTLSSSFRLTNAPSNELNYIGFRLASSLNPLNLPYFALVGDINNSNDSSGYGGVSYQYLIAQYLVTNCEYASFLNAVAATDSYNLYNTEMNSARGGISRNGSSGSYSYSVKTNYGNKPVAYVSWFDCARYCNWLHNGKGNGSTETGAYTLVGGQTSGTAPAKNAGAKYHIPTENEWYKAAYYKGGSANAGYWLYATQSDSEPTCVASTSNGNGPVTSNYSC
jgi:formylglycine-generating enzyme required for sulfatase activity